MFPTPILIIAYNRVEYAHDLFQAIRQMRPEKMYVSIDGAVSGDRVDYRNVLEVRNVFLPEWECDLQMRVNDAHLGKAKHVVSAIDWFFEQEPEGIILFDDTLPHPDFFPFCAELLNRYRNDQQIGHICGCNILKKRHSDKSYIFSIYPSTWGFATWRDRWNGMSLQTDAITPEEFPALFAPYEVKSKVPAFWLRRYKLINKFPDIDIWEYQYFFHLWKKGCLSVVPSVNLVENRGFATKKKRRLRKLNREVKGIMPLDHNDEKKNCYRGDKFYFRRYFRKDKLTFLRRWIDDNILND